MNKSEDSKGHFLKPWSLPFVIGGGMGFGALIGVSFFSDALGLEGPAGDMAGAAGVLIIGVCLLAGFGMTLLTLTAVKVIGREPVQKITFRLALSILGGGLAGALGGAGTEMAESLSWLILTVLPVLLAWPRRRFGPSPE
jgi:hypothetical protein